MPTRRALAVRAAEPMSRRALRTPTGYVITRQRPTGFTGFFVASEYRAFVAIVAGVIYLVGSHS